MELKEGMTAYLKQPYRGYRAVTIVERRQYKWLVETSSGCQIEVYEDELEID